MAILTAPCGQSTVQGRVASVENLIANRRATSFIREERAMCGLHRTRRF